MRYIPKPRKKECSHTRFVQVAFTISACPKNPPTRHPGGSMALRFPCLSRHTHELMWHFLIMVTYEQELWCWTTYCDWSELWKLLPGVQMFALNKQKCGHEKVPHCNQPARSVVVGVFWRFVRPSTPSTQVDKGWWRQHRPVSVPPVMSHRAMLLRCVFLHALSERLSELQRWRLILFFPGKFRQSRDTDHWAKSGKVETGTYRIWTQLVKSIDDYKNACIVYFF